MKKKAIAPLVSIILLITFAIVLGIIVMQWGNTYEQNYFRHDLCTDTEIIIVNSVCINHDSVLLENTGNLVIDKLKISYIADNDVSQQDLDMDLNVAQIKNIPLNIPQNTQKIKITPIINKNVACPKQGIIAELEVC